jgi:LacI family transcriptional regulator, galactose operon repressor
MPTTLEDIARALKVSKMTVSRAINNHPEISRETRARILAAAQKMNYRPNQFARALSTSRSSLIGIVVPDLMHSYFAEICRGVESRARPAGYQNLICSTDEETEKEKAEIEALLSRTDGLIVASAFQPREIKFYRRLVTEGARIVLIDRVLDGLRCSAVTTDDVRVGEIATEHLIKLGHRKIGFLRGTEVSTSVQRLEGYTRALAKHRLRFNQALVRDCGFTESAGHGVMKDWIKEGTVPPAVFAANDPAAIGAMTALDEAGLKVPNDVALVGGGNIHYGDMLRVPLTTVSWSKMMMGQAAAGLLLNLINGQKKTQKREQIIVEPELIVRQSCGGAHSLPSVIS